MASSYIVTEPAAPSTASYVRYGRGGAGNIVRAKAAVATSTAQDSHASPSSSSSSSSSARLERFFSGRGGVGNAHEASRRPAPSLDDEINRAAARDQAPVGHCGIGGAGNVFRRKGSDASSDASSVSTGSTSSSRAKLWARMSGSLARD